MTKNYQLYARILRLDTDFHNQCELRAKQANQISMEKLVKQVIFPDLDLVWC